MFWGNNDILLLVFQLVVGIEMERVEVEERNYNTPKVSVYFLS
jgi:hypothetical protein